MSMLWQRFTERAKRVVIAAQEIAANAGEPYVSPEHLLLGLVGDDDSVATKVLESLGVAPSKVRQEIERQIGDRSFGRLENHDVTLDPRMKRILDFAYDEARQSTTNYIGTEHLLLGIIREGDGIGFRTLARLGVDIISARKEVVSYLGGERSDVPRQPKPKRVEMETRLAYRVRKFEEAEQADAWLNEAALEGFRICQACVTANGTLWVIMEGQASVKPAAVEASPEEEGTGETKAE